MKKIIVLASLFLSVFATAQFKEKTFDQKIENLGISFSERYGTEFAPGGLSHLPLEEIVHYAKINRSLEHLAMSLARTMTNPDIRTLIHYEALRQTTGDFEVLFNTIENHKMPNGMSFRHMLAAGSAAQAQEFKNNGFEDHYRESLDLIDEYADMLPNLHIAVPVEIDFWDAETYIPLVTFVPEGIEDTKLVQVKAFDEAGNVHWVDAQEEPGVPVIVVALNERTDENGNLKFETLCPEKTYLARFEDDGCGGGGGGSGGGGTSGPCSKTTHAYGDQEYLYQIIVYNDHEPWTKGSPEIYASYSFSGNPEGKFYMNNVDDEDKWYTPNGNLFYWQSSYGQVLGVAIMEEDGGSIGTLTLTYGIASFTLPIKDNDDELGSFFVHFNDPNCGSYHTGDSQVKMRFQ